MDATSAEICNSLQLETMSAFGFNAFRLLAKAKHCIALKDWGKEEEGKSLRKVSSFFPCKDRKKAGRFPGRSTC